jgi:hypothetical protein
MLIVFKEAGMERVCSTIDKRNACDGKARCKYSTRKQRRRWEDNTKMDVRELIWGGKDCINLAHDRGQWCAPVNTVMSLLVP